MLLLTHSYLVPREKEDSHTRLARKLIGAMQSLGAEMEVVEELTEGLERDATSGAVRAVQISRFRDARHLNQVQAAEMASTLVQALIAELCEMVDMPGQQARGTYVGGRYGSIG